MTTFQVNVDQLAVKQQRGRLHVLTLTPFYPSSIDNTSGCFIADPISLFQEFQTDAAVIAAQPFYRKSVSSSPSAPADWFQYLSLPGVSGLAIAGALLFARIIGRIRKMRANQSIDLIHAHGPMPCGHAAMLLSHEFGIPFAVTVHGLDAFSAGGEVTWSSALRRRVSTKVFLSASRVICISERVRHVVLQGTGGRARTSVVYNGVDPDCFVPGSEAKPSTILCVGNLIPIKGHDTLICAAGLLQKDFPELRWRVIGDGPLLPELRRLAAEQGVADRIEFCGRLPRVSIAEAMRECTVFALPSRYEGLGCVYLEAMSCGKPIIGCRGQGIADLIQHGRSGMLVGPDNPKELALAITLLLRDAGLRRRIGETARQMILEDLTLRHQAANLTRIYREIG